MKAVPMIHVPSVRDTVDWYAALGFSVVRTNESCGELDWALLTFGTSEIMFNAGGEPSSRHRRDVDVYLHVDNVDAQFARIKDKAEIVEALHDTFYGMREFIIRDLNRFWITFGQPVATKLTSA